MEGQEETYSHHKTLEDTRAIEVFSRGPSRSKHLSYHPRILIVDDEQAIRTLVKRSLELQLHAEVHIAPNGQIACELIAQNSFDLIVSDMQMPLMTGLDLYSWIRIHAPQLVEHFFIISGDLGGALIAEELNHYGVQVLRKPFLITSLIHTALQYLPIEQEYEKIAV